MTGPIDALDMDHNTRFISCNEDRGFLGYPRVEADSLVELVRRECQCPGHKKQREQESGRYQPRHAHGQGRRVYRKTLTSHNGFSAVFFFDGPLPPEPVAPSSAAETSTALPLGRES